MKQFAYPNPVENSLQLQLVDEQNHITLSDVLGRKLLERSVNAFPTIDMFRFKQGIYFLQIMNPFGTQNMKIIKKQEAIDR